MYGVSHWHDEGSEVCWLKDDNVIVVILALIVVVASGQEVCFLVEDAGLVS